MKNWKRVAKRWFVRNEVITGSNGHWNTDRGKELVNNLANLLEKIYNLPKDK